MSKYKYYFRQPKSEIAKDVLKWLAIAGVIYIAASSPYFILNAMKQFGRKNKYPKKKVYDAFYRLRKEGYLDVQKNGHDVYISLTEEGKKKAGWLQINSLEIKKPKKWDNKWRIVMFDIPQTKIIKRSALRNKLKELGFRALQKSAWIHVYPCGDEIELLKDFFGLGTKEIRLITASHIGEEDFFRKAFKLD